MWDKAFQMFTFKVLTRSLWKSSWPPNPILEWMSLINPSRSEDGLWLWLWLLLLKIETTKDIKKLWCFNFHPKSLMYHILIAKLIFFNILLTMMSKWSPRHEVIGLDPQSRFVTLPWVHIWVCNYGPTWSVFFSLDMYKKPRITFRFSVVFQNNSHKGKIVHEIFVPKAQHQLIHNIIWSIK